ALRRYKQLKEKGLGVNLADLTEEIKERDERDSGRAVAPLKAAAAALQMDSTELTADQVFHEVMQQVNNVLPDLTT
ncbi:MAG: (d)CMP kinase, partial [Candidatus Thiodiazotropha sp. 6PLUC10]